jgi:hypothetical protein
MFLGNADIDWKHLMALYPRKSLSTIYRKTLDYPGAD